MNDLQSAWKNLKEAQGNFVNAKDEDEPDPEDDTYIDAPRKVFTEVNIRFSAWKEAQQEAE